MPRYDNINKLIRLAFHMDGFAAMRWLFPPIRSQKPSFVVECFDVNILNSPTNVSETPCDALVMPDDHIWQSWQRNPSYIECPAFQMCFIPQVRHLMAQVHIIRQKRLASHR